MTTYVYKNTVPGIELATYDGIEIGPAGVSYTTDNVTLNKYVQGYLDRYVDGVLSNSDVVRPDPTPITAQEKADHLAQHLAIGSPSELVGLESAIGIVGVAATFTTLTPANSVASTGFLQLSSAGVHGLTTGATHAGKYLYVTWTGGTGVSGLYAIKSVDSTTIITLDTTSTGFAGMGTPVVTVVGTAVPLVTSTIAAGTMTATSELIINSIWSHTSSANNKTIGVSFGGTTFGTYVTPTTVASTRYEKEIRNRTLTSQISSALTSLGNGSATGTIVTGTVNTANAQSLVISGTLATANEVMQLESLTVKIES